jgi:hypothetical protein
MYIEDRLFSETSDEVLYSVTMTEEEYDLFSEFQRLYSKTGEIQDLGVKLWRKAKGSGNNFRGAYKVPSDVPGLSRSKKYVSQLPKDIRKRMIKGNGHFGKGPDQVDVAKKAYLG